MDSQELSLRLEIIKVCRKLESKGLIVASDGNVSCRAGRRIHSDNPKRCF